MNIESLSPYSRNINQQQPLATNQMNINAFAVK